MKSKNQMFAALKKNSLSWSAEFTLPYIHAALCMNFMILLIFGCTSWEIASTKNCYMIIKYLKYLKRILVLLFAFLNGNWGNLITKSLKNIFVQEFCRSGVSYAIERMIYQKKVFWLLAWKIFCRHATFWSLLLQSNNRFLHGSHEACAAQHFVFTQQWFWCGWFFHYHWGFEFQKRLYIYREEFWSTKIDRKSSSFFFFFFFR